MNPTEVHEQLVAALRAAQELMIAMETCHICKGAILLQETPVYCEDCSFDCEEHEEPECPTIQSHILRRTD